MDLIYLITWIVTSSQMTSCPGYTENPYAELGVPNKNIISCAALHYKTVEQMNERRFKNRDSAAVFYEKLTGYKSEGFLTDGIKDIKIKCLEVKK